MSDVTRILNSIGSGDSESADELLPLVYDELRQLAAARMSGERAEHTLQAPALVHEAWIRLAGPEGEALDWSGRRHFFAAAAEAMRRILVDNAAMIRAAGTPLSETSATYMSRLSSGIGITSYKSPPT